MSDNLDPREALASIQAARAKVGGELDYSVGWDILYGLVFAALGGGAALDNPWGLLILVASMVVLAVMVRWWRARVGWWVNGYAPKRARWVAFGLAAVMVVLLLGSYWTRWFGGPWWMPIVTASLAWVLGFAGGRLWIRVYRKDLQELDS